jgi:gas vesicle protein
MGMKRAVTFFMSQASGAKIMRAVSTAEQAATESTGRLLVFSSKHSSELVQETLGRLQEEVHRLQAQLARTRQDLEQRHSLLRKAQERERELRIEVGVR